MPLNQNDLIALYRGLASRYDLTTNLYKMCWVGSQFVAVPAMNPSRTCPCSSRISIASRRRSWLV
jgi:hypothetical protein